MSVPKLPSPLEALISTEGLISTPWYQYFLAADNTMRDPAGTITITSTIGVTDDAVVRWDTTAGTLVQDSNVTISDSSGMQVGSPSSGGYMGAGTINTSGGYYQNGVQVPKLAVISTTYLTTSSTGVVTYTGAGFSPRAILFNVSMGGSRGASYSAVATTTTVQWCTYQSAADDVFYRQVDRCIRADQTTADNSRAQLVTFTSDGFSLDWGKTGAPTGTMLIQALCIA
jgi:hypothetical protein